MLQFPYQEEPLTGPVPHSLPASSSSRFRPLIPLTVAGPAHRVIFNRAVLDTGSDDTILPFDCLLLTGAVPLPDRGQRIVWGGKRYHLQYAQVTLFLAAANSTYSWSTIGAFSAAPLKYPLLGMAGCLEYFDARFRGAGRTIELEPNWTYPGTK